MKERPDSYAVYVSLRFARSGFFIYLVAILQAAISRAAFA
jgi:hypothetical protein